jgi:hypothetical protein
MGGWETCYPLGVPMCAGQIGRPRIGQFFRGRRFVQMYLDSYLDFSIYAWT